MVCITGNLVAEWSFCSGKTYTDPFNDLQLDVIFTGADGTERRTPAFWAGGNVWRVRFSTPDTGRFSYRTECSDASNKDLHGLTGEFEVTPYTGTNPLYAHGPIRVSEDKRYLAHQDGTPFFWLADTWWMGFTERMPWPSGFQTLALDRVKKGFTVVQIVAGLYPDMPAFDERGANEAGFPWETDFSRINPAYFDFADRRVEYMVEMGLAPCIVGCWGYYLGLMGIEKMKQHWRYLIARYGAYPVFWCLAGEGTMPFYLSEDKDADAAFQRSGWTELARFVHATDPFGRPVTIHPTDSSRNQVDDPSVLDFEMLQTGHGDRMSLAPTVDMVVDGVAREPRMPVLDSEVCYEGIGEASRQEVQRLMFWVCMLNGAAGHTYGANGIWQVNTRERPYGPSPHGLTWGNTPWEDAYQLPGSEHVGLGKKLLAEYPWWRFEPHPEWVEPHRSKANYLGAYAAGIPGKLRFIFFPLSWFGSGTIKGIEDGVRYGAYLFNPATGERTDLGIAEPDESGDWVIPFGNGDWRVMPIFQDWVLVMEAE